MKYDKEFEGKVLKAMEHSPSVNVFVSNITRHIYPEFEDGHRVIPFPEYQKIQGHLLILEEGGFVECVTAAELGSKVKPKQVFRITKRGHEYLTNGGAEND